MTPGCLVCIKVSVSIARGECKLVLSASLYKRTWHLFTLKTYVIYSTKTTQCLIKEQFIDFKFLFFNVIFSFSTLTVCQYMYITIEYKYIILDSFRFSHSDLFNKIHTQSKQKVMRAYSNPSKIQIPL